MLRVVVLLLGVAVRSADSVDRGCECIDRNGEDDGQQHDMDLCPGVQTASAARIPSTEECCEFCRKDGGPNAENWVWNPNDRETVNCWCKGSCATGPVAASGTFPHAVVSLCKNRWYWYYEP